jgi:hypothetical protein
MKSILKMILPWLFVLAAGIFIWHTVKSDLARDASYEAQIALLRHSVARKDTVYRHDTLLVKPARASYRLARDSVVAHLLANDSCISPPQVANLIKAADTMLVIDSTALSSARDAIIIRDSLIFTLSHPPIPSRFLPYVEAVYTVQDRGVEVRGGLTFRVASGWYAVGEASYGHAGSLGLGVRKTFGGKP